MKHKTVVDFSDKIALTTVMKIVVVVVVVVVFVILIGIPYMYTGSMAFFPGVPYEFFNV